METLWRTALWRQFGAAIDTLDNALVACPDALWSLRLWPNPPAAPFSPQFAAFWYVGFHTLTWLDLYLAGVPEADFVPPAPVAPGELDSVATTPAQPYARWTLCGLPRQRCRTSLLLLPLHLRSAV